MKDPLEAFYHQKDGNYSCKSQDTNGPHTPQAQVPLINID